MANTWKNLYTHAIKLETMEMLSHEKAPNFHNYLGKTLGIAK